MPASVSREVAASGYSHHWPEGRGQDIETEGHLPAGKYRYEEPLSLSLKILSTRQRSPGYTRRVLAYQYSSCQSIFSSTGARGANKETFKEFKDPIIL